MSHQFIRTIVPRSVRNWLRSPSKSLQYVADRVAYSVGASPTVSPVSGWSVRCHPAAKHHFEVFQVDPVQGEELDAFARHCFPGMRLLDIGAHYGFFALACLKYGSRDSQVLCVEASPKATAILRANLVLNGADSQVSVVNCAMGATDGELQMLTTGPMGGDYFVVPTEARNDTQPVPQRSLPSLVAEREFEMTHVKMDIESFEYEVVEAGAELLQRVLPIFFLELHGNQLSARGKNPEKVIETLSACGYRRFLLGGEIVGIRQMAEAGFNCRLVCLP